MSRTHVGKGSQLRKGCCCPFIPFSKGCPGKKKTKEGRLGTEPQEQQLSSETKPWAGQDPPSKHSGAPVQSYPPKSCEVVPLRPLCFLKFSHCLSLDLNLDFPCA